MLLLLCHEPLCRDAMSFCTKACQQDIFSSTNTTTKQGKLLYLQYIGLSTYAKDTTAQIRDLILEAVDG